MYANSVHVGHADFDRMFAKRKVSRQVLHCCCSRNSLDSYEFILEGKLCFTETISTIINFIVEGKLEPYGHVHLVNKQLWIYF